MERKESRSCKGFLTIYNKFDKSCLLLCFFCKKIGLVFNQICANSRFLVSGLVVESGTKGQLISKGLFGILEFFQKTNERIRHSTVRHKKQIRFFEESSA